MRIEDLDSGLLRTAVDVYLEHAWPGREGEKSPEIPGAESSHALVDAAGESVQQGQIRGIFGGLRIAPGRGQQEVILAGELADGLQAC